MPAGHKRWRTVAVDEAAADATADALGLPRAVGRVLAARGLTDLESARVFLNPRLSNLFDPFDLPDSAAALERIWRAIDRDEQIVVFGDYDADGITSATLLVSVLRGLGGKAAAFLPSRFTDGYGLTMGALHRCLESHRPNLIVTVDCGSMAVESVRFAREAGVDVIVTDHHEVSGPMAEAVAVVNPKRTTDANMSALAGVGVAFKLCHGLVKQGLREARAVAGTIDLREWLDLVAVGTVADMVPLLGENRILVKYGLQRLNETSRPGLRALIDNAGIKGSIDGYHVGFLLGPRLNAAGRLGAADEGVDLLLAEDAGVARDLARTLGDANDERKQIEESIRQEAAQEIDGYFSDTCYGLIVVREGWHMGTLGIVASRLTARYYRPSMVISIGADGMGHGSCRSIEELDMVAALTACSDLLERYGGHKMAAGLSIKAGNIGALRERFGRFCEEMLSGKLLVPAIDVAGWLELGEVDDTLWDGIQTLRPFGMGNPEPVWGAENVQVIGPPRVVGEKHLKLLVASGGAEREAIAFGMAERTLPTEATEMLFTIRENVYRGRRMLQLQVKDWR